MKALQTRLLYSAFIAVFAYSLYASDAEVVGNQSVTPNRLFCRKIHLNIKFCSALPFLAIRNADIQCKYCTGQQEVERLARQYYGRNMLPLVVFLCFMLSDETPDLLRMPNLTVCQASSLFPPSNICPDKFFSLHLQLSSADCRR